MSKSTVNSEQGRWTASTPIATLNLVISLLGVLGIALFLAVQGEFAQKFVLELYIVVAIYIVTEKVQGYFSARAEDNLHRAIVNSEEALRSDAQSSYEKMLELIANRVEVKFIGTHVDGLIYCTKKMRMAERFQDTYFRTAPDRTNKSHPKVAGEFYQATLDLLIRGGSFDCLFSKHNLPVFKELVAGIREKSQEEDAHLRLFVSTLDHGKIPLINLQILTYPGNLPREVVFGWNFRNVDDGLVFSSTEEKIVHYFLGLFEELRAACTPADFLEATGEPGADS